MNTVIKSKPAETPSIMSEERLSKAEIMEIMSKLGVRFLFEVQSQEESVSTWFWWLDSNERLWLLAYSCETPEMFQELVTRVWLPKGRYAAQS